MPSLADLQTLWQLARRRRQSEQDYRQFQAFQAGLIMDYLADHQVHLAGKRVLDLGSGIGGYSQEMGRQGASVLSLDLVRPSIALPPRCSAVVADALALPLLSQSADVVFCASLIEHVADPARLLAEIGRVLVPEGYCYLSFPPFYSPMGGHEFAPFHYLGERWAVKLSALRTPDAEWARALYQRDGSECYANAYGVCGLHRITIRQAKELLQASGLEQMDLSTRYLPLNPAVWPLISEVATWHVQFLLRKPACPDESDGSR